MGVRQWCGWGGWWGSGVGRGFNWSFEQNRYCYFRFGCRNSCYDTKSYTKWGNPRFQRESPCYDIIISQKCHFLTREKSENEMCRRFHLIIYARRSGHLGKLKIWLTSSISNSNISLMSGHQVLIFQLESNNSLIWWWHERQGLVFSGFWVKIGGDVGPGPMGLEISNYYCGVMDAFWGLKLIICRDIGLICIDTKNWYKICFWGHLFLVAK